MGKILIADDDLEMCRMLASTLRCEGYETSFTTNGETLRDDLIAMYNEGTLPDILIADIQMPGITGLHLLKWARQAIPAVAIVLITGFGDAITHTRAENLGATALFDKPFELADLRQVIQLLLGKPRQVRSIHAAICEVE